MTPTILLRFSQFSSVPPDTYKHQTRPLPYTFFSFINHLFYVWDTVSHSWTWALLEKPPIVLLLKNFPAFYGTVFTRALHWSLSWARSIQSIQSHPIFLRYILILSTYLRVGLPSGLLHSGFPTNILHAFLFFPITAICPVHLILLGLLILN
jgi:hypothetical protein